MRWLAVSVALAGLLAATLPAQDRQYDEILTRHARSLGDASGLRTKDLYALRTVRAGDRMLRVRTLIRAKPFAYRNEVMPIEPPMAGLIAVSDGRHAWQSPGLMPEVKRIGAPLRGQTAMMILEQAFLEGFHYLDREHIARVADAPDPWNLPPWPGLPEGFAQQPRVQTIPYRTPAGSVLSLHFDADDGRLHEVSQTEVMPKWRIRFGAWRDFGAFHLPSARATEFLGPGAPAPDERATLDELRAVESHPEVFFAGNPAPALPREQFAGRLLVVPDALPGSACLVLDELTVNGSQPVRALLDVGATDSVIDVRLADALHLPLCGISVHTALHDTREEFVARWIDELRFGEQRVLQIARAAIPLSVIAGLDPDRRPGMLLGNTELLAYSPVFDSSRGQLFLRAAPAIPLVEVARHRLPTRAAGRVIDIAATEPRRGREAIRVPISIGDKTLTALIDTGSPPVLRLQSTGLARLGWVARAEDWLARGALPVPNASGSGVAHDLATQIDEFRLGPVRFVRPWVLIADPAAAEAAKADAVLGCGAFLPFSRFGWNDGKQVLELESPDGGAEVVIASAGYFLGLAIVSGRANHSSDVETLPLVIHVVDGSPAGRAGVRVGERVRAIAGQDCAGVELRERLRSFWSADVVLTLVDAAGRNPRDVRVACK